MKFKTVIQNWVLSTRFILCQVGKLKKNSSTLCTRGTGYTILESSGFYQPIALFRQKKYFSITQVIWHSI